MKNGWICLHRQIFESPDYFEGSFDRIRCWVDLLLLASAHDRQIRKRGQLIQLRSGDVATSLRELAGRWQLSVNTVKNWLGDMQSDGRIEIRRENVVSVIHIKNYSKYQRNQAVSESENGTTDTLTDTPTDTLTDTPTDTPTDTLTDTPTDTPTDTLTDTPTDTQYNKLTNRQVNNNSLSQSECAHGGERTCVRGAEDSFEEFLRSSRWQSEEAMVKSLIQGTYIESVAMRHGVARDEAKRLLQEFHETNRLGTKTHENLADLRQHFVSWLNKRQNKTAHDKPDNDKRRGYEAGDTAAADYGEAF